MSHCPLGLSAGQECPSQSIWMFVLIGFLREQEVENGFVRESAAESARRNE
jgi:hypothetical protein